MTNPIFTIPLVRAIEGSELVKAFAIGQRAIAHKYYKRERHFRNGKLGWTYWYRTDDHRRAGKAATDPQGKHEHKLLHEQTKVHDNLIKKARPAIEATVQAIKEFFGWADMREDEKIRTQVRVKDGWTKEFHAPWVQKEKQYGVSDPAPQVRVIKALEMIPDHIKRQIGTSSPDGSWPGLKTITFAKKEESKLLEQEDANGLALNDGRILISHMAAKLPVGEAKYGTQRTFLECVVGHEIGHTVYFRAKAEQPEVVKRWSQIFNRNQNRITPYAGKDVEEDFAETFSAALYHPKQLAQECPERYKFMKKNFLPEMRDVKDMLRTPDYETAWWEYREMTPTAKLGRHLQEKEPTRIDPVMYYSDKDQFYSLAKDGRQIYFRYGPPDKISEPGWERMSETIDPVTMLPRYEKGIFTGFRTHIKEIFDENGNRLTDKQALFYLGQDDEKIIRMAEGKSPEVYRREINKKKTEALKAGKTFDDNHTLSRRLNASLGGNDVKATLKLERERVERARKGKGRIVMYRHDWCPVEIGREEFYSKSGTFAFHTMKPAKEQKSTLFKLDNDGNQILRKGKPVVETGYNALTGKQEPLLSAKTYEQQNPDGTFTRIEVQEASEFLKYESINVPMRRKVKDPTTGETHIKTEWERYKIKGNESRDPKVLAEKFGTTTKELLLANRAYGKWQIMDPIISALINPTDRPIKNEKDLVNTMISAAKAKNRTWISISGGSRTAAKQSIAHIQLEWDGGGSPKVVGDYWAKKLGKEEIRLNELLAKRDMIKLPAVDIPSPKKLGIEKDKTVWVIDPKSKKRVMATLLGETRDEAGKRVMRVQPLLNQGVGVSQTPVAVSPTDVTGLVSTEIPGKRGKVRRHVKPTESDLLIYADEILPDADKGRSGVLKMLLPKDGSVSKEEALRIPGVSEVGTDPDQKEETELHVSPRAIPAMRDYLGGFVMESHASAMMNHIAQEEILQKEKELAKKTIKKSMIEDADGNINAKGPLGKNLVTGADGIQPAHRTECLQKLADNNGAQCAVHFMGTGKSALGIMASALMRNLKDDKGNPHPMQVKAKVMHLIELSTVEGWQTDYKQFSKETPTVLGSSTLPGALQIPKLPERKVGELEDQYAVRAVRQWKKMAKAHPKYWNPWADANKNFIIAHQYCLRHKEALRALVNTGMIDGSIPDEIHKMLRKNQLSLFIEEIRPEMKLFLGLTGTPINNRLDILPRLLKLVSGGKTDLGTQEEFRETHLVGSEVQRALGARTPARTDIDPAKMHEVISAAQPLIDVKNTSDVKGKTMPLMFIDESQPAHMTGQQAKLYRLAMAKTTRVEREAVKVSAELGVEEAVTLTSEEARARVAVARAIANCGAYKMPDEREFATYEAEVAHTDRRGKVIGTKKQKREFQLPSYEVMTGKKPNQWNGKWPSANDVKAKRVDKGYLDAMRGMFDHVIGRSYEMVEGKPIDRAMLNAIKKGKWESPTGQEWLKSGGKVLNPEYGPEGMICRGTLDKKTGEVKPIPATYHNALTKETEELEVRPGLRFIRDPNQKTKGLYYIEDDWDHTSRKFLEDHDSVETIQETETEEEETELESEDLLAEFSEEDRADIQAELDTLGAETGASVELRKMATRATKKKAPTRKRAKGQGPKPGKEEMSVTRSTYRRRERAMFDVTATEGNAKCDKMEEHIRNVLNGAVGDKNPDDIHFTMFGNLIGSSCRTMEAKLRTMGFQDVNEALGHSDVSSEEDKAKKPRKYFVTYMGKGATLGDRSLNSEIYRHKLDKAGKDSGVSMFVWRTLYGTSGKPPKIGEIEEGWSRKERDNIAKTFMDGYGRKKQRSERFRGLEVPMRVKGVEGSPDVNGNPTAVMNYVYESEMNPKERARINALEIMIRGARGAKLAEYESEIAKVLDKHWTDRQPLTNGENNTPDQHYIFNNCQFIVASDAAQMGINWPGVESHMYDSLFSPMDELQRMARSARLLPPITPAEFKPVMEKIDTFMRKTEKKLKKDPMHHNEAVALGIVQDAIDSLSPSMRRTLLDMPGGAPDQVIEMHYCQKAFDKIAARKSDVEEQLRVRGYRPDPTRPPGPGNFVPPEAITNNDIMNVLIRDHLTPLEQQMMRSRKALVYVKRYLNSCEMPVMVPMEKEDEETGETITVDVQATDEQGRPQFEIESPIAPQMSQLAQGRAKAVPYENLMRVVQEAVPVKTPYDFIPAAVGSLETFSILDPSVGAPEPTDAEMITIASSLPRGKLQKADPIFMVNALLWDHILPPKPKFISKKV